MRKILIIAVATALASASSASAQSVDRTKQLFDQGKYAQVKASLAGVQTAAAAYYLGRIAIVDGKADEAIRHLERAVELEDGNALYHLWLGNAIGESAATAGMLQRPGIAKRMKVELERAVELDPNQIDARAGLVMFYSMAPGMMGGSVEKAREHAREITKRNAMRGALARAEIAQNEKDGAAEETALKEAIAAAPDTTAGYVALADMYGRAGRFTEAFATIERYGKRRPSDRWTLYYIGRLAGSTGQQLDRGEAALKQFLAAPPASAYAPMIVRANYWLAQIAGKRPTKS
jgi:predicted Zn-dependent protease